MRKVSMYAFVMLFLLSISFLMAGASSTVDSKLSNQRIENAIHVENDVSPASGWLSGWSYRKSHIINSATGAGTDYQIRITVHFDSGIDTGGDVYCNDRCRTDFGDIRFTDSTGSGLLNAWNESQYDGLNVTCWVQITDNLTSANSAIYMYYGNSGVSAYWNGTATFPLWDDFNNGTTINTNIWETGSVATYATISQSGGLLQMNGAPSGTWNVAYFRSKATFTQGYAVRAREYWQRTGNMNCHWYCGFGNPLDPAAVVESDNAELSGDNIDNISTEWSILLSKNNGNAVMSFAELSPLGSYVIFETRWQSSYAAELINDVYQNSTTNTTVIPTTNLRAGTWLEAGANFGTMQLYVDWFVVRKYVDPEPTQGGWGSEERRITVPDDYSTIQEAINAADDGDTIFVRSGTYCEHVIVNKTVTLNGEDEYGAILDGGSSGALFNVIVDNVTICNFAMRNCDYGILSASASQCVIRNNVFVNSTYMSIDMSHAENCTIRENHVQNCKNGFYLGNSDHLLIVNNTISDCEVYGIVCYYCNWSIIADNIISNNGNNDSYTYRAGISLAYVNMYNNITQNVLSGNLPFNLWIRGSWPNELPKQNLIYHNNILSTRALDESLAGNFWSNSYPSGGNYWSDFNGTDSYCGIYQNESGSDGIGDAPYAIDSKNVDDYPLMKPWTPFEGQTIYIREDGSVDPSGAAIQRKGDLYTLTGNINSNADGIVIQRDNMALEGSDYTIRGKGEYTTGIGLYGRTNVTVQNFGVESFGYGIVLSYSSNDTISGNNITANGMGICIGASSMNTLSENNITNNGQGMSFASSSNNTISENNITASTGDGLELCASSNNKLTDNVIADNYDNFIITESSSEGSLSDFVNDADTTNKVDGKPVYYWIDRSNMTVPSDAGYVVLVNCTRITAQGLNLTRNGQSLLLAYSTNSIITENDVGAVALYFSSDNSISENDIRPTSYEGIYLHGSSNNNISENNITTSSCAYGVWLEYCSDDTISGNNVANCFVGIQFLDSSNNMVSGNSVANCSLGISVLDSSNNISYHNNFIDNYQQVQANSPANAWDNGYPSGGNYWSDYNGIDACSGPSQNISGSDGIGDTPYIIDANNLDNYPLMNWSSSDIAVTDLTSAKTVIGQGYDFNITVRVANFGSYQETFNLTLYVTIFIIQQNVTLQISSQNVTLESGNYANIAFVVNTAGYPYGNYTLSACAEPVSGEINIANNNFTGCWVAVSIKGDLTGGTPNALDFVPDGKVDIVDVATVAKCFGQKAPPASANCDVSGSTVGVPDGKIDISDVALVAKHFGDHYP